MASFLYCSPYSYSSTNYRDSCLSFTLLKALAKSTDYLFAIASKSEKEQQLLKINSNNFTRSNREISQYCKINNYIAPVLFRILVTPIIFSQKVLADVLMLPWRLGLNFCITNYDRFSFSLFQSRS